VPDQVYAEEQLNDLMKSYKKNLDKAKVSEAQRKNELISNAKLRNPRDDNEEKIKNRMRKHLETKSTSQIEEIKSEDRKTIDGKTIDGKTIDGKTIDGKTIDGNIKKIEELYQKMIKKEDK
jgi:Fic family protein